MTNDGHKSDRLQRSDSEAEAEFGEGQGGVAKCQSGHAHEDAGDG